MAFPLETIIQDGMLSILGSSDMIGVAVIAVLSALVMLMPTPPGVKVIAVFGGVVLAVAFLGWALMLLSFGLGVIIWFALRRLWA